MTKETAMKSVKKTESIEIISFNEQVPEVSSLLDLEDDTLDMVVGCLVDGGCGSLTDCPELTCIGKCGIKFGEVEQV